MNSEIVGCYSVVPEATDVASLMLLSACLLLLAGCATPNYALKPEPLGSQSSSPFGDSELVRSTGHSANVAVVADVDDLLKSRYLVVILEVTNTSSSTLALAWSSFKFLCCSPNGENQLLPLEPEALIAKLSKERASGQVGRGWGTFFQALAAAHHDPGANVDVSKVSGSINGGVTASQFQSQNESRVLRKLDSRLIRVAQVPPGTKTWGYVFFPFSKSESYKLRVKVGEDAHEFLYRLRSY
jgi:hypothetical protein